MISDSYITPETQVLPRHVVAYKQGGVWQVYHTTYNPETAKLWQGALLNNSTFNHEGVITLECEDNDEAVDEMIALLNW